jgi:hypothetical protein
MIIEPEMAPLKAAIFDLLTRSHPRSPHRLDLPTRS